MKTELTGRTGLTLYELAQGMEKGALSSLEITRVYLGSIRKNGGGAYLTVCEDEALKQAASVDEKRAAGGKLSPLAGIPAGIKDNICTKGIKTTCASKMLESFVPPYDATVIEKLKAHHYVLLGKLNMDEFSMGAAIGNASFKFTRNPHGLGYVPGGSSEGSAAAVAAFEAAYTLGSDTGGEIRRSAALHGVVGMKPTYGAVSRYGLAACASSLEQIGPLTRNVRDNALVLSAIIGRDERDATSVESPAAHLDREPEADVKGVKIGLPRELFDEGIRGEVREKLLAAASAYERLGAAITWVSMPSLRHALPAYDVISGAEAFSSLARFDGVRYGFRSESHSDIDGLYTNSRSEGFGPEVKRRVMLGAFALSTGSYDACRKKALRIRALVAGDFREVFEKCNMLLSPAAPAAAYGTGEQRPDAPGMDAGCAYTVPANLAGIPALSLPCGVNQSGLPIGMQLMGPHFSEPLLYRAGYAFEQANPAGIS